MLKRRNGGIKNGNSSNHIIGIQDKGQQIDALLSYILNLKKVKQKTVEDKCF